MILVRTDESITVKEGKTMKKALVLVAIILLYGTSLYAASGDLIVNGNLGAGATSPAEKLDVNGNAKFAGSLGIQGTAVDSRYGIYSYKSFVDPSLIRGIYLLLYPTWTGAETAAEYAWGLESSLQPIINTNHINSGSVLGVRSVALRNSSAANSDDNGTLQTLMGIGTLYGNYFTNSSAAPITTNAYGIYVAPYAATGRIDNMYDIYLGTTYAGGTAINRWGIYQNNTANNRFGGNVGIGTTNMGTGGSAAILLGNGTKPANLAGVAGLYASSETGITELMVFDSAGNSKGISPHAIDAPDWMYDAGDGMPMIVKEIQQYVGYVRYTNLTRQARLASMTDAEKSALSRQQRTCVFKESFADHNARLGLAGDKALVQLDWDTEQQAIKNTRDAERLTALNARAAQQTAKTMTAANSASTGSESIQAEALVQVPEEYVIQPMPARLRAAMDEVSR